MSPRRKFEPGESTLLVERPVPPGPPLGLPIAAAVAAVLMVVAIGACTWMLVLHESHARTASKEREVVGYAAGFMSQFTSIDPYHANDYVTSVLGQATGDFAKRFREKANEILLQLARAEPATGTVLGAGLERWNDDGSATVMVATEVTSRSPDEKQVIQNTNRWVTIVTQEGNQWKISNLLPVI